MTLPADNKPARQRQPGFSLVELLVALVVTAVIAGAVYPVYSEQGVSSRRSEGKVLLAHAATTLERYYFEHSRYVPDTDTLPSTVARESENGHYALTIRSEPPYQGYTLAVVPQGFTDPRCGSLTLDHAGTRGVTGSGSIRHCWGW